MIAAGATAQDLIPGDPREPEGLAAELDRYAHGADEAAARLNALDGGIWFGEAAEAFRAALGELPARLRLGTEAFGNSARALRHYAEELRAGQATAARVVELAAQARQQSAAYEQQVADYQAAAAAGAPAGPAPPPVDPGAETMAAAERMLAAARERVDGAAQFASNVCRAQAEQAPDQRSIWETAWHYFSQFWIGVGEGIWGSLKFIYHSTVYVLIDPGGWVQHWKGVIGGVAYSVTHPVEFAKSVGDWWEDFKENPARMLGRLGGGALVGGGVAKTLKTAKKLQPDRRGPDGGEGPLGKGPLGSRFERGVHDPNGRLMPKERETAELLASEGKDVRVLPEDHSTPGKSVDTLVRSDESDNGTYTELKSLDRSTSRAVKDSIFRAQDQLGPHGGGEVVIDGRRAGLDREAAEAGLRRALGEARTHDKPLPDSIRVIAEDGSSVIYSPSDGPGGGGGSGGGAVDAAGAGGGAAVGASGEDGSCQR